MKLLVVGRAGQVARSLQALGGRDGRFDVVAAGRPEVDLEDAASIAALARFEPDLVVNAAAYTAVDRAEDEPETAFRVNGEAPGLLARMARTAGAAIVHLSTDYVFDGTGEGAYDESAPTAPLGVYGRSKLEGEERVRDANPRHLIVRTAWVYSATGTNFVRTMLRLAGDRDVVRVVADQRGNPTSADDLAAGLLEAAAAGAGWGTYHLAGAGTTSWAGLAEHIFACAAEHGLPAARVEPIATADYPTRARRPANSALNSGAFARAFGYAMPPWRPSVDAVVRAAARPPVSA